MKQLLLAIGILMSFTALAQKEVVSAYNANKDGDYRTAATYIEQAILVEKSAVKDKTWRYRGQIYLNIAADPEVSVEYPNALVLAKEILRFKYSLVSFSNLALLLFSFTKDLMTLIPENASCDKVESFDNCFCTPWLF